ncbi:hypothetical protein A4G99_20255 [Haladaptatus sp. R4]|nr:hypothetical protein A4G99_20255 [Haladaptatus sp. R4]
MAVVVLTVIVVSAGCSSVGFARSSSTGVADSTVSSLSSLSVAEPLGVLDAAKEPNNSTAANGSAESHHVNPSKAKENGQLSELDRWYLSHLSSQLGSSTVKINRGQYRKAHSVVGSKYDDMLGRYVDVAERTDSKRDDRIARQLNETGTQQRTYVTAVRRYHRLHGRYQTAKENGKERKARKLARRLNHLQKKISNTNDRLTHSYGNVSNSTGKQFKKEVRSVHRETNNVTKQQMDVRKNEFTKTRLTVRSVQKRTSYRNPLRVTGVLRSVNGTTLANRTVRLRLTPNHTVTTKTRSDGTFSISGRPRAVHLGTQPFDLRYVPADDSVYLGDNRTVESTVNPTRAKVVLHRSDDTASFQRHVTASGSVRAAGGTVTSVPVVLFADGKRIGSTTTGSDGIFHFRSKLPANVSAGKRTLRVQLPYHGQALRRAKATTAIRVRQTPTSLSLTGNVTQGRNVTVHGRLTTKDGRTVPNRSVAVLANGTPIGTVETDANGTYRSQLRVPPSVVHNQSNGTVVLATNFGGGGTNLAASRTRTRMTLQLPGTDSVFDREWLPLVLGGALAGLLLIGGVYVRRRGDSTESNGEGTVSPEAAIAADTTGDSIASDSDSDDPSDELAERANAALTAGDLNRAAELAYAAVRSHLETTTAVEPRLTHWEFYRACRAANIDEDERRGLETVTNAFERVSFTGTTVSSTLVSDAVRSAEKIGHGSDSDG